MITCSDLHERLLYINPDLLERIEITPDTQLVFINGKRTYVKETPEEIVDRIVEFRKRTGTGATIPIWHNPELETDENRE